MKKTAYILFITIFIGIGLCRFAKFFNIGLTDVLDPTHGYKFNKKDFIVIEEMNTHGGFNGDGSYCLVLDCSKNKDKAYKNLENWRKLPLPQMLSRVAYGQTIENSEYSSRFPEEIEVPQITNGYYYFYDRHNEATDRFDSSELYDRYSFNFDFAIYNADTDIMYFIKEDT